MELERDWVAARPVNQTDWMLWLIYCISSSPCRVIASGSLLPAQMAVAINCVAFVYSVEFTFFFTCQRSLACNQQLYFCQRWKKSCLQILLINDKLACLASIRLWTMCTKHMIRAGTLAPRFVVWKKAICVTNVFQLKVFNFFPPLQASQETKIISRKYLNHACK